MSDTELMRLAHAFVCREKQVRSVSEQAAQFNFRWLKLNAITMCIHFHNQHNPGPTGTGNQAACPENEQYDILVPTHET